MPAAKTYVEESRRLIVKSDGLIREFAPCLIGVSASGADSVESLVTDHYDARSITSGNATTYWRLAFNGPVPLTEDVPDGEVTMDWPVLARVWAKPEETNIFLETFFPAVGRRFTDEAADGLWRYPSGFGTDYWSGLANVINGAFNEFQPDRWNNYDIDYSYWFSQRMYQTAMQVMRVEKLLAPASDSNDERRDGRSELLCWVAPHRRPVIGSLDATYSVQFVPDDIVLADLNHIYAGDSNTVTESHTDVLETLDDGGWQIKQYGFYEVTASIYYEEPKQVGTEAAFGFDCQFRPTPGLDLKSSSRYIHQFNRAAIYEPGSSGENRIENRGRFDMRFVVAVGGDKERGIGQLPPEGQNLGTLAIEYSRIGDLQLTMGGIVSVKYFPVLMPGELFSGGGTLIG